MAIRGIPVNNHYELLGIARTATPEEIKRAFRRLAFQYHPDRNREEGAAEKFKEINKAYEVLGNPKKKADYDAQLESHVRVLRKSYGPTRTTSEDLVRVILEKDAPGLAKVLAGVSLFLDAYLKVKFKGS